MMTEILFLMPQKWHNSPLCFILLCNYKIRLKKISQTSLMEGPAGLMTE